MNEPFIPVSQSIANHIRNMIFLEKKYQPGDKLPNEYELAALLGVSRASLREAIKILAGQGLLLIRRGSGTFVAPRKSGGPDWFEQAFWEDQKKLVRHWFEFRLILEPSSARLAAEQATEAEVAEIHRLAEELVQKVERGEPFIREDQAFHTAIATATHNSVITMTMPALEDAVRNAITTASSIGRTETSSRNAATYHQAVAEYIALRDGEGAQMAMRLHILHGLRDLEE